MIKTRMIQDGVLSCDDRLDDKINKFIKDKIIVDIKFTSVNNRATALVIYEVEENAKETN